MRRLYRTFRSFDRPSQVLMVNQFTINLGFYMLMPYLAAYLAGPLALAAWAVGLVLGIRNFSQQGMFLVGGTLADRWGYKPLIVAGCLIRVIGFILLACATSLPAILIASAATGFAGALFNPAVRAYLAADAGERRVEAFAVFNVFYQAGILLGPLVGLALTALDFRLTSLCAAGIFAILTIVQIKALPSAKPPASDNSVVQDWRTVLVNRRFLLFAVAMTSSYVLSFQIYLALPLHADRIADSPTAATGVVTAMFAVTGLVAIAGQLRITSWFARKWGNAGSLSVGMAVMAAAFLPLIVTTTTDQGNLAVNIAALLLTAAILAAATAAVFPFEMDTMIGLANGKLVATHYGLYNTIVGAGILLGNAVTGWLYSVAATQGRAELIWVVLLLTGTASASALFVLNRRGWLALDVGLGREVATSQ
ncbi:MULTISPECIES: MFS transporter [Gordonia]|uniref:MFS transporter n=1 Tax=Gordonia amicalis TaxID=89053 RepID=A0ABU4D9G7_9ACTN|nr:MULTISPECIES: MFS transporter [Gordonia]ATD71539.1 MFS transporter [Gordonia sp. 1D]MCZ4579203.1 MFS transporter [Gordonia amicalis]MDJ0452370.1 MFS transporter [Gordonia amicalis]MDV6306381.1 MFS transporter [Gordonia amicalis]MDV7074982.1 MFS transporter [Gordonia amicalis]